MLIKHLLCAGTVSRCWRWSGEQDGHTSFISHLLLCNKRPRLNGFKQHIIHLSYDFYGPGIQTGHGGDGLSWLRDSWVSATRPSWGGGCGLKLSKGSTSKVLTHTRGRLLPLHTGLSTGPLDCPYNVALLSPDQLMQEGASQADAILSLNDLTSEVTWHPDCLLCSLETSHSVWLHSQGEWVELGSTF